MPRALSNAEILKLAGQAGVRKVVESFLMEADPGQTKQVHMVNLSLMVALYRWNAKTVGAIRRGIHMMYQQQNQEGRDSTTRRKAGSNDS